MATIRVGANKKYTSNWAQAFSQNKPQPAGTAAKATPAKKKASGGKKSKKR